ncbi:MAG: bifunctional DNA-formamidopyrimidine glycosylase/DNA-(apurinic or apyrimidinic site) lyase, partial [Actinomycetota bacterium]|nr:bifunctional DNA-formamidopyrimidine glycosylase/DNA-(apurinic or apyrimidinic site) lyase [Actinomycetota bacterium]
PEVEVVRRGVAQWATHRVIDRVEVHHPRAVRRQDVELASVVVGRSFSDASRRGKYLWLPIDDADQCLVVHLGMSGQLLIQAASQADERHLRIRFAFADGGPQLRFVDQRTFGSVMSDALVFDSRSGRIPESIRHIARDPLDPDFDDEHFLERLGTKHSEIKRLLLDQTLISGIGNIYADESLWRARIHATRAGSSISRAKARQLLADIRAVMSEALAQGGTSFDSLYVNVNGESGYFSRSLNAYGREGAPCPRCGTPIRRARFMNRSSFYCPRCQRM